VLRPELGLRDEGDHGGTRPSQNTMARRLKLWLRERKMGEGGKEENLEDLCKTVHISTKM